MEHSRDSVTGVMVEGISGDKMEQWQRSAISRGISVWVLPFGPDSQTITMTYTGLTPVSR